jgi:hypothetical protein
VIPYQTLTNHRNEPLDFLTWVAPEDIQDLHFICYTETFHQLAFTFLSIANAFGIRVPALYRDPDPFLEQCMKPGNALADPPRFFLKCSDQPLYLAMDWVGWLTSSNYLLELPQPQPS